VPAVAQKCPCCFDEEDAIGISPRAALASLVQGNSLCERHEAEVIELARIAMPVDATTTLFIIIPPQRDSS
jgi:hypothetical protein